MNNQTNPNILHSEQFPRSNNYDPLWVFKNQMGPNPLWLVEFLSQSLELKPGMRVLDLGCGRGMTSVFLAREFGVQVYAVDLWDAPDEKWNNAKECGVEHLMIPIQADARKLPFAKGFFDAILCIDSYFYFGADNFYLGYITEFLRPNGKIGMVVPGLMKDFTNGLPKHLVPFWEPECWAYHTRQWWRNLWERTELVSIDTADYLPDGCALWLRWNELLFPSKENRAQHEVVSFTNDIQALKNDNGDYMGFVRLVAAKRQSQL